MDLDWVTEKRYQVLNKVEEEGRVNLQSISDEVGSVPSTVYRTCNKLISLDLLEKNNDDKYYTLTDKGRNAYKHLSEVKAIET